MRRYLLVLFSLQCIACLALSVEHNDFLFVVLNNDLTKFGNDQLKEFYKPLLPYLDDGSVKILSPHLAYPEIAGGWALWPVVPRISDDYNFTWLIVCEYDTRFNFDQLKAYLNTLQSDQNVFTGHALHDRFPTIIHHFAFAENPSEFLYPDTGPGFVMSRTTVQRLVEILNRSNAKPRDFTIDMKHELAVLLWDNGHGVALKHEPKFCFDEERKHQDVGCISTFQPSWEKCNEASISLDHVYFAVKTFHEHHKSRVVVLKRTWGKNVRNMEYFSDESDSYIPTTVLPVPNTARGHCEKTLQIIRRFAADDLPHSNSIPGTVKWLVIADDDTLLNVPRLMKLLSCYDSSDDSSPLIIGERYGFGFRASSGGFGYDYPTGGSGMVFNRAAAEELAKSCKCPSPDSPDDMILGACAKTSLIPIVHNSCFHQARPDDYSLAYLKRTIPISFHKHWQVDPYKVFTDWLQDKSQPRESHVDGHEEL